MAQTFIHPTLTRQQALTVIAALVERRRELGSLLAQERLGPDAADASTRELEQIAGAIHEVHGALQRGER